MFYLKSFFSVLFKAPFRGISFVFFTVLLVGSLGQKNNIDFVE